MAEAAPLEPGFVMLQSRFCQTRDCCVNRDCAKTQGYPRSCGGALRYPDVLGRGSGCRAGQNPRGKLQHCRHAFCACFATEIGQQLAEEMAVGNTSVQPRLFFDVGWHSLDVSIRADRRIGHCYIGDQSPPSRIGRRTMPESAIDPMSLILAAGGIKFKCARSASVFSYRTPRPKNRVGREHSTQCREGREANTQPLKELMPACPQSA